MAQTLRQDGGQLALYEGALARRRVAPAVRPARQAPLCAGCRTREARYGFRQDGDDPSSERARTLCFGCFRMEMTWRQDVAARLARGWNAAQTRLPLEETLKSLSLRRRRAQIAARHALAETGSLTDPGA